MLDLMGPQLQVLWCPSHEGIPGNERANDLAESGSAVAESEVCAEAAPGTPVPQQFVDFCSPGQDPHPPLRAEGSKRRRLLFWC